MADRAAAGPETIGFIGLGAMGKPMAHCLLQAGYAVTVCPHTNRAPAEALAAAGATVVATPRVVAEQATIVITMVPDSPQVEEAVLGAEGVLAGARSGTVLIDMSSIAPSATRRIGRRAWEVCSARRTVAICTKTTIVAPQTWFNETAITYVTAIITTTRP